MEKIINSSTAAEGSTRVNVGRSAKKGKAPDSPVDKFYIGSVKDGIPLIEKEVSEAEALLGFLKSGRTFLTIQTWMATSELKDGKLVTAKTLCDA